MRALLVLTIALMPGAALAQGARQTPAACEALASLSLPNAAITLAQVVSAGGFAAPANPAGRGGGGSSALAGTLGPVPEVPGRVTANTAGLVELWAHAFGHEAAVTGQGRQIGAQA